ncbi:MAG: hypothetical protein U0136_15490 [Bdellovibrionota bacterium]
MSETTQEIGSAAIAEDATAAGDDPGVVNGTHDGSIAVVVAPEEESNGSTSETAEPEPTEAPAIPRHPCTLWGNEHPDGNGSVRLALLPDGRIQFCMPDCRLRCEGDGRVTATLFPGMTHVFVEHFNVLPANEHRKNEIRRRDGWIGMWIHEPGTENAMLCIAHVQPGIKKTYGMWLPVKNVLPEHTPRPITSNGPRVKSLYPPPDELKLPEMES